MVERTFDRLVQFDDRSRSFPIREMVPKSPRSYTWSCRYFLDQGREGACVGFGWAHELGARPAVVAESSNDLALRIYREAQKLDEWPGEDYSGTSVIAGAKVVQQLGFVGEYRWAFGLDDLILAIGYKGPAVLGLNWYSGMFQPDDKGYIHANGRLSGGHAILCRSVNIKRERFLLHNSWGADWGINGGCWISFADLDRLLNEDGEACIPVTRERKTA